MDSDNENMLGTPPEVVETAEITSLNLLREKSKKLYEKTYDQFMTWRLEKQINSFSERVLLAYFGDLSSKYKSSTLWTYYSMLRSTLNIHHNIKIEEYQKLRSFLKRKGENYQPKKARILSSEEISKFITEAPDVKYLATKVALIMGIMGACCTRELCAMQVQDLQDLNTAFIVTVPKTKTKETRRFAITDDFYTICKKYFSLRPHNVSSSSFFINYQNGRCTLQKIGINKFGGMAKEVATYLKLPNPNLFTGHCFRRSSATSLMDEGGVITYLKRHGRWKSTSIAEGHTDKSLSNKMETARKIMTQVNSSTSSGTIIQCSASSSANHVENSHFELDDPTVQFSNCSVVPTLKLFDADDETAPPQSRRRKRLEARIRKMFVEEIIAEHDEEREREANVIKEIQLQIQSWPHSTSEMSSAIKQEQEDSVTIEETKLLPLYSPSRTETDCKIRKETCGLTYEKLLQKYDEVVREKEEMKRHFQLQSQLLDQSKMKIKDLESEVSKLTSKFELESAYRSQLDKAMGRVFSQGQLDVVIGRKKRIAWSSDEVTKALTIRNFSKDAYIYLKDTLKYPLPGMSSLQRWASKFKVESQDDSATGLESSHECDSSGDDYQEVVSIKDERNSDEFDNLTTH